MQLTELKNIFHLELDAIYAKEEVDNFFFLCVEKYTDFKRFSLVMQPNLTLSKEEEIPFFTALTALKKETPIQYILGETYFMDSVFKVTENVLIPRPETEELAQWIIDDLSENKKTIKILDIGTGSGCIAISLAKELLNAVVYALDISEEALEIARENAELNGVSVNFIHTSILESTLDLDIEFDVIVSNPPYVRVLEKSEMHTNVKAYEPSLALFVPDENPLVFYKAIAEFCRKHLLSNGMLYLEINQYLGDETKSLFENENFEKVILKKDIFENDRMLRCEN